VRRRTVPELPGKAVCYTFPYVPTLTRIRFKNLGPRPA
jgi:hypothetical protein